VRDTAGPTIAAPDHAKIGTPGFAVAAPRTTT
jgi:hypothetical protein